MNVPERDVEALVALRPFLVSAARHHGHLDHRVIRSGLVVLEELARALRAGHYGPGSDTGSDRAPDGWITSAVLAAHRQVTTRAITKAAKNRKLRAVKVWGRWWIDPEELLCDDTDTK